MLLKREKNNVIRIVFFVVDDGFKNMDKWLNKMDYWESFIVNIMKGWKMVDDKLIWLYNLLLGIL